MREDCVTSHCAEADGVFNCGFGLFRSDAETLWRAVLRSFTAAWRAFVAVEAWREYLNEEVLLLQRGRGETGYRKDGVVARVVVGYELG